MTEPKVNTSSSTSVFKFLITTDNHLGYMERDPRRGDDSFTTFEECLRAARVEHDVDAILLGGDLFHDNKPSLGCLARTSALFRTYVLGDKSIEFALLSDPKRNFPTHAVPLANFQDPNINIAVPVFMIHGNHDDPVGGTSPIDILSTNGLVNYFGQVSSLDDIVVEPVLLQKGSTYIALYGIGNVRDERMHRCFRMKKLRFVHPKPVSGHRWFRILLLHQNRGVRGGAGDKGGVFETMLAGLGIDLVIWGNEHEQLMAPHPSEGYDIVQPGSTILTSLSGQECNPKQYGVLEVREGSYRLTPFPLRSVRPVVRRTIELWRENPTGRTLDAVEDFLRRVVEEMIGEAEDQISRIPDDVLTFHPNIKFPLMRLSVDFMDPESTSFPQPNINRFGQQYMDVVVNPGDLLRPVKPKPMTRSRLAPQVGDMAGQVVPIVPQLNTSDIRTKVAEVFNANARDACSLLSEPEVSAAVYAFVEKCERDAIDERIGELLNKCQKSVWKSMGKGELDGILKPDTIYGEVVRHKQDVNKLFVEAMQHSMDAAPPGKEATAREEAMPQQEHEAEPHRQRGNLQRRGIDPVDDAEEEEGTGAAAASSSFALQVANRSHNPIAEASRDGNTTSSHRIRTGNVKDEEDEDEDALPGHGIMKRGTVNALVAHAVRAECGAKRLREEDEDDDVMEIPPPNAPTRGKGRGGGGNAAKPAKAPRAPRGKRAAATTAATGALPMLPLTRDVVPEASPPANETRAPATGAPNLLTKWSI